MFKRTKEERYNFMREVGRFGRGGGGNRSEEKGIGERENEIVQEIKRGRRKVLI